MLTIQKRSFGLIEFATFLLFINSMVFIFGIFNSQYFPANPTFLETFSYVANDPPWMPIPEMIKVSPFWGTHYFGDFLIWVGYSYSPDPYTQFLPAQSLPLAISFFKLITSFGVFSGFYLFFVLSLVLPFWVISKYGYQYKFNQKVFLYTAFIPLSAGTIVSLDRGSSHLIVFSLVFISFFNLLQNRSKLAIFYLILAISIKPYILISLLFLIKCKKYREFLQVISFTLIINLFLFYQYPGGILINTAKFIKATFMYQDPVIVGRFTLDNGTSLYAALQQFASILFGAQSTNDFLLGKPYLTFFISLFWLFITVFIVLNKYTPIWLSLFFSFATFQMIVAANGKYAVSWVFIIPFIVFFDFSYFKAMERIKNIKMNNSIILKVILLILVFISTVPTNFMLTTPDGAQFLLRTMLTPLVIFFLGIITIFYIIHLWLHNFSTNKH
jgi:hypothetical protein